MSKELTKNGVVEASVGLVELASDKMIFGSAGEVSLWFFSAANKDEQSRIDAVQKIASICYQSNVKVGTSVLYDNLKSESLGLPSSSFEFVPILLRADDIDMINSEYMRNVLSGDARFLQTPRIETFGVTIVHDHKNVYKLTNLRALLYDMDLINSMRQPEDKIDPSKNFFNDDPLEQKLIDENFFVFNSKIDIVTARQFMRHRAMWQELSRRYVSGEKVPFEVYLTDDIVQGNASIDVHESTGKKEPEVDGVDTSVQVTAVDVVMLCLKMYDALIESGVKPQDARRIIPQGAMTQVWSAWFKPQFDDMIKLRSARKAQWEIRTLAKAMNGLVERTR
jgi:thymidylate synthase (FAD)